MEKHKIKRDELLLTAVVLMSEEGIINGITLGLEDAEIDFILNYVYFTYKGKEGYQNLCEKIENYLG